MPLALDLADLPGHLQEELWVALDAPPAAGAERTPRALRAALADVEATRRVLRKFPAYCLVMLELLCEAQGSLSPRQLMDAMAARGLDTGHLSAALDYLLGHGLVFSTNQGFGDQLALVQPRAGAIAALVLGLSAPDRCPPEPPRGAELIAEERDVLAVATLAGHRKLRWTADGSPNKATLRTFSRGLGPAEERVEALVRAADRAGLLQEADRGLREPRSVALRRAAERGLASPRGSLLAAVDALLPEAGWTPALPILTRTRPYGVTTPRDLRAHCAGRFVFEEYEGALFVARPSRSTARTGDGHVTPSFEVLLGPGAHPDVVVTVGLFSELVRLDRVLTFKITEASVHAGLRHGPTVEEFLGALTVTGRHGVPDNVALTVRDFAARASIVRPVWALQVPPTSVERLQRELGPAFLGSPSPGLVLASAQVSQEDLALAMTAAGLHPVAVSEDLDGGEAEDGPRAAARPAPDPDPVLKERLAKERAEAFRSSERALESAFPHFVPSAEGPEGAIAAAIARLRENDAPPRVRRTAERFAELVRGVPEELEAWFERLAPARAAQARRALRDPLELLPYAALGPEERARILEASTSWPEALELIDAALDRGHGRPEAVNVMLSIHAHVAHAPRPAEDDRPDPSSTRIFPGPGLPARVRALVASKAAFVLATRKAGALTTRVVVGTALVRRGTELVLLAEDQDDAESFVVPLAKIAWLDAPAEALGVVGAEGDDTRAGCPCGSGKPYARCHGAN